MTCYFWHDQRASQRPPAQNFLFPVHGVHAEQPATTRSAVATRITTSRLQQDLHETRDSISLISYAGCLGLSPVYFSENSL